MTTPTVFSFDFETFYSKDYSIRNLGNFMYVHHTEFDPYLLTVEGDDGWEWAGNPVDFEWERFDGAVVSAHNAGFELAITKRLIELKKIDWEIGWAALYDTADLAAYCGSPRSLEQAALNLLGIKVDKGMRDRAKGKHWKDMTPEFQQQMLVYAKTDAKLQLQIWKKYESRWPQWERDISQMTRDMCETGVPIDVPGLESAIKRLKTTLWETETSIPWMQPNANT